ncbi:MAG: acetylglutamate kinase [Candidatus Calescibacterium sp.]|nr:acetylglutamate kinase [Candidatus Calescibacterium sp.]MCX7734532.1 acetylglutamate kinase [bacterium]MDW8087644.1 acetylglutamate kinase [Candidatus Calescibacterium sp.]
MLRKEKFSDKAEILTEAIPYFLRFRDKIFVFKIGGKILDYEEAFETVAEDIVVLSLVGIKPIIVHGGGKEITRFLELLGIKSEFKDGIRETDDRIMEAVEMVLDGKMNGRFVSAICKKGGKAIGISGRDNFFFVSERVRGRVGTIKSVKADDILKIVQMGFIPVFSPITVSREGLSMNTNADEVACELAISLSAEKLIILTDEDGILDKDNKLIKSISDSEAERLISEGVITGGMIPKVRLALKAVKNDVKKVHIISGLIEHSILLEIFTDEGIGTEIVR